LFGLAEIIFRRRAIARLCAKRRETDADEQFSVDGQFDECETRAARQK
jgi:hypothetical protein